MSTACFLTPRSHVRLHSERLESFAPGEHGEPEKLLGTVPLAGLERVVFTEQVAFTIPALAALARLGVPAHCLDGLGHALGDFLPLIIPAGQSRLAQYQAATTPATSLALARALVLAKLANQYRVVQRLELNRPMGLGNELVALEQFQHTAATAENLNQLRGVEGAAAALFFNAWARFLPAAFPFEHRSRRPPHNPVNACLSFGAALLYQEMKTALHLAGLDTTMGFLHTPEDGRHGLALDAMEPFRPVIPAALTLRLFNLRLLDPSNFEPAQGGVYLNTAGRRIFIQEYEQRVSREFSSEHAGHRTTLRQQFRETALGLKTALSQPELFRPFRLN